LKELDRITGTCERCKTTVSRLTERKENIGNESLRLPEIPTGNFLSQRINWTYLWIPEWIGILGSFFHW